MTRDKIFDALFFTLLLLTPMAFSLNGLAELQYILAPAANMILLLQIITKPKLRKDIKILSALAVFFSLVSVFTFFYFQQQVYFVIALMSYVLSLIIYTILFYHNKPYNIQRSIMVSSILLIFSLYVVNLIYEQLGSLFPLTILYIIIVTILVQTSYLRLGYVSKYSYYFGFFGSIVLMLSSSLLMIDRFHFSIFDTDMIIQLMYCIGLFMVIKSVLYDKSNLVVK
ncbi:MAG: lysoplasmalogenase family protein [Flavobacteriaceae bacterium]|nr:lysoplasmalogenase family protein [Flavobacteriaceae bacterium]